MGATAVSTGSGVAGPGKDGNHNCRPTLNILFSKQLASMRAAIVRFVAVAKTEIVSPD